MAEDTHACVLSRAWSLLHAPPEAVCGAAQPQGSASENSLPLHFGAEIKLLSFRFTQSAALCYQAQETDSVRRKSRATRTPARKLRGLREPLGRWWGRTDHSFSGQEPRTCSPGSLIALRLTAQRGRRGLQGPDYAGVAACGDGTGRDAPGPGCCPAPTLDWGGSREEPSQQGARVCKSRADHGEAWG